MRVSSWVVKPVCTVKVLAGKFAPATDHSILRSLNMSMPVRTRKIVTYASEWQSSGKETATLGETRSKRAALGERTGGPMGKPAKAGPEKGI